MKKWLTVEEARGLILEGLESVGSERVMVTDAVGRVLARAVAAPVDAPRFDNSARDGYAVRAAEATAGKVWPVALVSEAGGTPPEALPPGAAARIMTGAIVPQGADAVLMREECEEGEGEVRLVEVPEGFEVGAWVRRRGSFVEAGAPLVEAGVTVGPGEVGALAGFGVVTVEVGRRPLVAIVTTGDELVELGEPVGEGQIPNSNAAMLAALVAAYGGVPWVLPIVRDDEEETHRAFAQAAGRADLVISSGGVSVGDRDFVRGALEALGEMSFWQIQMRPGKPLAFGRSTERGVGMLGLPGNPVSSFVCFHQFVRPALARLVGVSGGEALVRGAAVLGEDVASTPKRRHYVAGRVDADGVFWPTPEQDSGNLRLLVGAEALAILEVGVGRGEEGMRVEVDLI